MYQDNLRSSAAIRRGRFQFGCLIAAIASLVVSIGLAYLAIAYVAGHFILKNW